MLLFKEFSILFVPLFEIEEAWFKRINLLFVFFYEFTTAFALYIENKLESIFFEVPAFEC
jgi:hypothetical protein